MKTFAFDKSYNGNTVLNYPGFEFESGKVYAIIGANGSGKSTLAKILAGIEKPDCRCSPVEDGSIGYMPQKSYAFKMSTIKNVLLNGNDYPAAKTLTDRLGLSALIKSPAKKLSGGETAKLALARIMIKSYDLLILDEPTAPMDMESTIAAEALMKEYAKENDSALILITHSLQQALRIADYTLFFSKGKLIEYGATAELLNAPKEEETKVFLDFYRG